MADLGDLPTLQDSIDAKVTDNAPLKQNTGTRVRGLLKDMADTLWNHAGVNVGTCLFVNATTGDNDSGVRGSLTDQFETIDGALAASGLTAGDTIIGFDSGIHSITSLITLNINFYFPNATISGPVKLAVNDVEFTAVCKILKFGVLSVDGVGDPTTGTKATIYADSSTSTIKAAGLTIYGGVHDTVIGGDLYCNLYSVRIGSSLSVESGLMVGSVISGTLTVNNSGNFNCALSSIAGVSCASPELIGFNGCHFTVPLDPATNFVGDGNSVGIPPLLSAFFSDSTTDADPGDGQFRADSGTFASITKLYVSGLDFNGNDITAYLDGLGAGKLEMRTLDYSKRILFDVTSVTTASGYRKINVTPVLGALPEDGEFYTFDFREAGAGGSTPTLAEVLAEGAETSGEDITVTEGDSIAFEQGVYAATLSAPASLTADRALELPNKSGTLAVTADVDPLKTEVFTRFIEVGADKQYCLDAFAAFPYTIVSLAIRTGSGTCNATVKIGGTPVTGISGASVDSTGGVYTAGGASSVSYTNRVVVELDTTVAATDIELTLKYTRT